MRLVLCFSSRRGLGRAIEIVVFLLHCLLLFLPEGRRLPFLKVPGNQPVARVLEGALDEAGAGDDVAVLLALDVVVGVLEEVQQLAALESKADCLSAPAQQG